MTRHGCNISVVIPFFERISSIAECVLSTRQEGVSVQAVIVVDSASPFTVNEVGAALADIQQDGCFSFLVVQDVNRSGGPSANRNLGVANSIGEYVAFLDDDDRFLQGKLSRQFEFMKSGGYAFTYTGYWRMSPTSEPMAMFPRGKYVGRFCSVQLAHFDCEIATPTVMLKRECIPEDLFPEELRVREDQVAWWRMAVAGHCPISLNECLTEVFLSEDSLTRNQGASRLGIYEWPEELKKSRIPLTWKHKVFMSRLIRLSSIAIRRWI